MQGKQYYVYMMTNAGNTVIYTGVTSDLKRRAYEHREGLGGGFTKRYNVVKLVYYEVLNDPASAIAREKQIKSGPRQKKVNLVCIVNKGWRDLYEEI
ncbi:MAG: GIY-YIG nuclease family protein [Chloroflexota bacterium]